MASKTKWTADLKDRIASLNALAATSGTSANANNFVWHGGRYVVFHFDLMTVSRGGSKVDRSGVYGTIKAAADAQDAMHLGGSVYAVPLSSKAERSKARAVALWNAVAADTAGALVEGDAFFLHYSTDTKDEMGGVAQVVPAEKTALSTLKVK